MTASTVSGQKFFVYDEIDHYFNDFDESDLMTLSDNISKSELDSLKEGFITGGIPQKLSDVTSIDKLEKIGFKKQSIDKSKFADIDEIFSVKPTDNGVIFECISIYRDILIFKKNGKIIGVAKICFGCSDNIIIGTKSNTSFFGQNGDYKKLLKLLENKNYR